MPQTDAQATELWLLYEIPRHQHPNQQSLRVLRNQYNEGRGYITERSRGAGAVAQGLKRLRRKGLAEKYRPPAWPPSKPQPWRLTTAGMAELERRELELADNYLIDSKSVPQPEVWRDKLDGGWGAAAPDLPGCISQGDTKAEALANLAEARHEIEAVLERDAEG